MREIPPGAVVTHCLGPFKSPEVALFKDLRRKWPEINQARFSTGATDKSVRGHLCDKDSILTFLFDQVQVRFFGNYQS